MALKEKDQIVKELLAIPDQNEKFKYLIQKGKKQDLLDDEFKIEKYKIKGCQSQLWLVPELKDGMIFFKSDSDAAIPKGIAAILVEVYSNTSPDEALQIDPGFLKDVGVEQHLSMNRSNGLSKLVQQIKLYATAFKQIAQLPR